MAETVCGAVDGVEWPIVGSTIAALVGLLACVGHFRGDLQPVPPMRGLDFSAIRKNGLLIPIKNQCYAYFKTEYWKR